MSTASETILALEKALEAGPTPGVWSQEHRMGFDGFWNTEVFAAAGMAIATLNWLPRPTVDGVTGTYREANAAFIATASPLAIRTLLDAHASALQALQSIAALDPEVDSDEGFNEWGEAHCFNIAQKLATAALDDNTKKETT